MSGLDPGTARALSYRLAVEQSQRRLPSVAAGLVRGGEMVWSDAVGPLDGMKPQELLGAQLVLLLGS